MAAPVVSTNFWFGRPEVFLENVPFFVVHFLMIILSVM